VIFLMEIFVCIDDTDNLDSPGTGHLAEILRRDIVTVFDGTAARITRHQLFVSDDIPYTSHNSTMCFTADIRDDLLEGLIAHAQNFLQNSSAEGSDPGLCVAVRNRIGNMEKLIEYGMNATRKVLSKNEASMLAHQLGVHLSEHGGTGGGIIGALAGVGLRLGGNNGRFKGWINVRENDRKITVDQLCREYQIADVRNINGKLLAGSEVLVLNEKIKTVLLDGKEVLPVKRIMRDGEISWENLSKDEIRRY